MSDYTPSLDEVREVYVTHSPEFGDGSGAEFDRMIEAVRAEAIRDAATWVEGLAAHDGLMYRESEDGEESADSIPTALRVRADRIEREAGE